MQTLGWISLWPLFCAGWLTCAHAGGPRDFDAIDRHALAAPAGLQRSPQQLVEYLVQPARDDTDKARAIFRWLAEHVEYDVASYLAGTIVPQSASDVLTSGKAVCSGFATAFESLARLAGLEAVSVHGYAKGFGYQPGDAVGPANHDWNAVRLQGRWQLLDATWAAGGVDERGQYRRRFEPFYFLADPALLAYSHLPEDPRWRLLDSLMTPAAFAGLARPQPAFFRLGLDLARQRQHTLAPHCNRFAVSLDVPSTVALTATLTRSGQLQEHATLVQRHAQQARVEVVLPAPGEYRLNLYAKPQADGQAPFDAVLTYRITASKALPTAARLPESYATFREVGARLHSPLAGQLALGGLQVFALTVPGAAEVAVVSAAGDWTRLERNGAEFAGAAPISGATKVVARFGDPSASYFTLLAYQGVAAAALSPLPESCAP